MTARGTRLSMGFLAGMLGLGAACGGSSEDPNCANADGFDCHPSGLPFVEVAGAASDSAAVTTPATSPRIRRPGRRRPH